MRTSAQYYRRWFRELKLTYEEVAEVLEVHPITVRKWEINGSKKLCRLAFDHAFRPYFRPEWRHKPRGKRGKLGP